ncbi:MAG: radical SAM protein [Candidatus Omnitrophica bacterium]|nr:radical SAM protein [Candidatus Omnitrophota bacterium]
MKILLAAPSVDTCYEYVSALGLMNLHLIGKELGCDMELIDLSTYSYKKGLAQILSRQYDLIGISCNFTNAAPYCMRYAKDIKEKYPDTIVISGGNHATLAPEDLLLNSYDYIIYGEGEASFKEFLHRHLNKQSVKDLKGLYYLEDGKIVKNPPREPIEDLDTLPFNDYSEFNLKPYFKWAKMRYINIETSRGCIYNCAFCATVKMWGHRYRHKSPKRILDEFKVAKRNGCDFVFLCDDDTAIDEQNLRNLCELLIKEKIILPWGTTIGSRSVRDESTLDLMAQSGCVKINICIESANPRILKEYRKPYAIEDNRRMCANLLKKGIVVHNHGIIGFPNETFRETLKTYFYLIKTSPIWHISILEPRPGTDYWENWDKKGDFSQYRLFGKANVILSRRKYSNYLIYRLFALYYFLNPRRIWNALFHKNKAVRYSYWIQYYVAYRTIKANFLSSFRN